MVKNLRKLRTNMGISQQQLADVIGTTQQSINKYENHNVEPDICTLGILADYFNTTIDYLVGHITNKEDDFIGFDFTKEEIVFVDSYRKLTNEEKESIELVIRNYMKNKKSLEI